MSDSKALTPCFFIFQIRIWFGTREVTTIRYQLCYLEQGICALFSVALSSELVKEQGQTMSTLDNECVPFVHYISVLTTLV